jgi:hypothetical protein
MNLRLLLKLYRIQRTLKRLVGERGVVLAESVTPSVFWGGAYHRSKVSVFVIAVQTDRERDRLRADQQLSEQFKQALVRVDWPEAARPHVEFEIESEETVKRESGGNWWAHPPLALVDQSGHYLPGQIGVQLPHS